jgi:erythromycin esterase
MTMRIEFTAGLSGLALVAVAGCAAVQPLPADHPTGNVEVVHVAPPTGEQETDRASILAALAEVEPGGIVQFAPGTYLIGPIISVKVPRVTLLGHPDGTTLRGCNPDDMGPREYARAHCMGLELAGGHQTIRGFTFEYGHLALHLGCCRGERAMLRAPDGTLVEGPAIYRTEGGHLVEGNTFRRSANGIRMNGDWTEPAVVRGNRFIDNWHGVSINGNTVHLLDNDFAVPEPEQVPFYEFPNDAVKLGPTLPLQGVSDTLPRGCAHNVVAGNRIDGSKNGISIMVWEPGTACRHNVIRDNTITVRRARVPSPENFSIVDESDSTFVGIPISLLNYPEAFGQNERGQHSAIEDNVIEGNRIIGAEGIGIEILYASRNRIVNNTTSEVAAREPFPGNTMDPRGAALEWREANGSGIWISPGSDGNEIAGNVFNDIAAFAVVAEGDSNRVELRSAGDSVRDLGTGNRVRMADGATGMLDSEERREPLYDSKFVETRGIRLQYMDFGGSGLPVIFLQDFHNYFDPGWDSEWPGFYARFADVYRVLAPIRRGYGESDDTGWGYDVATQSEDLLGLMDALGIRRAVLIGRQPANQDMTWIAEHHPERLAGLVYMGNPLVFPDLRNPLVRTFEEMTWRSCDLGERSVPIVGPRAAWRPDFLHDEHARIDLHALRFVSPWDTRTVALRVLPRIAATGVNSRCDDEARREYFAALAADEEQVAAIREALEEADLFPALDRAIERAFGDNLRTEVDDLPKRDGWGATHEFYEPHMRRFLEDVARAEAGRPDEPAAASLPPVARWLASEAIGLRTTEPGSSFSDLQPLKEVVGDARIVALGEPTHGNREVFQLKHRMIEFLVTEMGFNVFALESPMAETFDLNEYVLTGIGDPASALAGIRYWTWDTEEVLELIEWIREYNANPAHMRKVRFYGFDVQDPERAARVTLDYLRRVDPDLAEGVRPALGTFATGFSLPEYGGLRPIIPGEGETPAIRAIGDVVSTLDARRDEYVAATSDPEWTLARQHARLLARYIEASSNDGRDWSTVRDRAMAENVGWILEHEGPDTKIILWAHNSHVANAFPWGIEALGSHLRRMYGPEVVIFGFLFNRGGFRAIDAGAPSAGMRNFTVGQAPEGTVEAMLASAGLELAVVDLRRVPPGGAVADWFREPRPTRHSGGGYNESDPERYLLEYKMPEAFDALVYLHESTPVRPVNEADYDVLWVRQDQRPMPVNLDFESGSPGEAPEGWLAWSKHRRLGYEMLTTADAAHQGSHAAMIRRAPGKRYGEAAASLSQRIDAARYRGMTIRLRAASRAELANDMSFAFLRLAIDGRAPENIHDQPTPAFDSLDEYQVTSSEWRIYEIVADVPEDAVVISYGLFLAGEGSAWIDDVSLEVVDD